MVELLEVDEFWNKQPQSAPVMGLQVCKVGLCHPNWIAKLSPLQIISSWNLPAKNARLPFLRASKLTIHVCDAVHKHIGHRTWLLYSLRAPSRPSPRNPWTRWVHSKQRKWQDRRLQSSTISQRTLHPKHIQDSLPEFERAFKCALRISTVSIFDFRRKAFRLILAQNKFWKNRLHCVVSTLGSLTHRTLSWESDKHWHLGKTWGFHWIVIGLTVGPVGLTFLLGSKGPNGLRTRIWRSKSELARKDQHSMPWWIVNCHRRTA